MTSRTTVVSGSWPKPAAFRSGYLPSTTPTTRSSDATDGGCALYIHRVNGARREDISIARRGGNGHAKNRLLANPRQASFRGHEDASGQMRHSGKIRQRRHCDRVCLEECPKLQCCLCAQSTENECGHAEDPPQLKPAPRAPAFPWANQTESPRAPSLRERLFFVWNQATPRLAKHLKFGVIDIGESRSQSGAAAAARSLSGPHRSITSPISSRTAPLASLVV